MRGLHHVLLVPYLAQSLRKLVEVVSINQQQLGKQIDELGMDSIDTVELVLAVTACWDRKLPGKSWVLVSAGSTNYD
ncbi:unannotated protein [freshwater metagenome]|uniref:Unannotated protein n=1 Tax=freshwater metagenome TaxID=449393 RepID=A0A6J6PZK5_9ZZZZ